MRFGEKVRQLRNKKKLSQTELGKLCGLSLRTIRNYEVAGRYPKKRDVYSKLSAVLGCSTDYLLTEADSNEPLPSYDENDTDRSQKLISNISAFFTDNTVSEIEKDAVMKALRASYSIAKKLRKRKIFMVLRKKIER